MALKNTAGVWVHVCVWVLALSAVPLSKLSGQGVPYIINYSKREYKAANQNWSAAQSPDDILYFANSEGLLEFDGTQWRVMHLPDRTIVRSVAIDTAGRIYTGSYQEFGYWEEDEKGAFHYTSLSALLGDYSFSNEEIWKIIIDGDRVYFQSISNKLFLYGDGTVKAMEAPDVTLFAFKVNGRIIVQGLNKGLYILENERFNFWDGSGLFAGIPILTILPFSGDRLLIGTATHGLYLYDGTAFRPWGAPAGDFLKKFQLNNGIKTSWGYVFGTIQNGIIITDSRGRILQHLSRENGLQNNTVLSLCEDGQHNLWLGLDNGIDYVELNREFNYYQDRSGLLGSVYDAALYDGKLYLGTNHGIFYREYDASPEVPFTFLADSYGQAWSLDLLEGQLLFGHNEGTFLAGDPRGETLRKISDATGGWVVREVPGHPGLLLQGTYTGLAVFRRTEEEGWAFSHRIPGFTQPIRYLEFDHQGNLWVSKAYEGVYRIRLRSDLSGIDQVDYFDSGDGFPSDFNINVFKLDNQVVFATGEKIYTYDPLEGRIVPFGRLNEGLDGLQAAHRIIPAGQDRYWFVSNAAIALVRLEDNRVAELVRAPFSRFIPQMVSDYQNIVFLPDSTYLFCLDDGFCILPAGAVTTFYEEKPARLFIRRAENLSDSGRLLSFAGGEPPRIRYNKSNIKITYAAPFYGYAEKRFQVLLEGFDGSWSAPSPFNYKEYTNLPAGTYTFRVRLAGAGDSAQDAFTFRVLPPWYASWWAFLSYLILAVALIVYFRRRYYRKLQRKHQQSMDRFRQEKEEQLRQERLLSQQVRIALENEKLQTEIAAKSNELANSTMAIIKKNEVLIGIKEELKKIRKQKDAHLPAPAFHKLSRLIESNISNDDDWRIFEQSFNRAHEDFFRKLKNLHPDLTPNDLRLCAYLKMNISSKEIAPLLNISVRGVEIRRYRLRKRLQMEHDENLVEYMMAL